MIGKEMAARLSVFLVVIYLAAGVMAAHADMVILKSGDMYQTRKAWRQDDRVFLYRDGEVIRLDASDVERVIADPPSEVLPPAAGVSPPAPPLLDGRPTDHAVLPDAPATDGEAGYQGLRWGMPPSRIAGLKQVGIDPDYGGVEQYVQADRGRRFGRARVDRVVLGFWQGGLYTIVVEVSNFLDFRELKAEAFRRFGKWRQRDGEVEKGYWTDAGADRLLAYDVDSDTGYLWMRSRVLHHRVAARYPD